MPTLAIYGGVGQATGWRSVGDAPHYFDVTPQRVYFIARTGAKLLGHIFTPQGPGPHPGVVITTGSIQASQQMYWFAARALVWAGYQVMTFDVQGQGQSETLSHDPEAMFPGTEGVPSQQNANFFDGTVDALRFFLSTPAMPYVPQGWSALKLATYKATTPHADLNWNNPGWGGLDRQNIGIAGHSLGASAVSGGQACSDAGTRWQTEPVCHGQSFPIRAVVAWDALSGSAPPVVPAMSQQADGYFLFPTLSPTAPAATDSLAGYDNWKDEGLDTYLFVIRGGTHIDFSQVPYTSATTYGYLASAYYTIAWFDRWVKQAPAVRQAAYDALVGAPRGFPENPWSANHFSARRFSAMSLRSPAHESLPAYDVSTSDLRAWAGRSAVGDWAGANADVYGRVLPTTSSEAIDAWPTVHPDNDCEGPEADAQPGTPEFQQRDQRNQDCAGQRLVDRSFQPLGNTVPTYGADPYRNPDIRPLDNVRFHFSRPTVPGQPSVEVYKPCSNAPGDCPTLPAGLHRFDPPYPAVILFHGFVASKELHRWTSQMLAEEGYYVLVPNGDQSVLSAPNLPIDHAQAEQALVWLRAQPEVDVNRIGMCGHSAGGSTTLGFQGDPRISAMIAWDGGSTTTVNNLTPIMYQLAEQGFATPTAFTDVPGTPEAASGYNDLKARSVDVMGWTGRAFVHVDFNGNGGPGANRLAELFSNYYNLAWFDRHLKGKLVLTGNETPAQEAAERANRQAIAKSAYDRLIATHFDNSADRHNISMGFWDPVLAVKKLDPTFGGNVPYAVAGKPVGDRMSFYYRNVCYVSVPDYIHGGDGTPGSLVANRADSTIGGDMRTQGCPEVFP